MSVTEMALAGNKGAILEVNWPPDDLAAQMFGEDQGRYVVTVADGDTRMRDLADELEIPYSWGGVVADYDSVNLADHPDWADNQMSIPLADLRAAHEGFFPALMQGEL